VTDVFEVDFLVLGGGMAGMTAASVAAASGCRALVVEKSRELGGSAVLSGGKLWTGKTYELLDQETPGGDPALKRVAFDLHPRAVEWLKESGIHVDPQSEHLHYGSGHAFDVQGYIAWCAATVIDAGGFVVRDTICQRLIVENGGVVGALLSDRDGETEVRAPHTLLATGGFPASPKLLECFVNLQGARALARCSATNAGDGIRLGVGAGGALSPFMKGFYGHVMMHPVDHWGPREFRAYTQGGGSVNGILLNLKGKRFCDESLEDHRNAQRILEQPEARALIVFDSVVRDQIARTMMANVDTPTDGFQMAVNAGANVAIAETWEELFAKTAAWGYDESGCLASVREFNRLAEMSAESGAALSPPRRRRFRAQTQTPLYAVEGQTGVTATHGGLRIDDTGRVLDSWANPVPGLHAAGADAGNMHGEGYAGGLNFAATFGLLAADHAIATLGRASH
jgi:succinate dehydrogenase/fumarate reductase flavoprotein subunit